MTVGLVTVGVVYLFLTVHLQQQAIHPSVKSLAPLSSAPPFISPQSLVPFHFLPFLSLFLSPHRK